MNRNDNALRLVGLAGSLLVVVVVAALPATAAGQPPPGSAPPPNEAAGASTPSPSTAEAPPVMPDSTTTPAPPPPEPAPPPPPHATAPPPPQAQVAAPPPSQAAAGGPAQIPLGTAPKGPVAPAFPPAIPSIDFGGRLRASVLLRDTKNPGGLGDASATVYADLYASGQITRMWSWLIAVTTDNYGGTAGAPSTVSLNLLDAMATFAPFPELQLTVGRMLVMADRYTPSGPWGLDEWFYPGFFVDVAAPALPKSGPVGRDVGLTLWGVPLGGHVKYYLGAYQLQDPNLSPLVSGRVQVSLLSREPGWFHRTTYYGDRDLVSVGVGGQVQSHGSVMVVPPPAAGTPPTPPLVDDFREVNADLIVEKRLGASGALSLEAAYYNFHGTYQPWKWLALGAVAYNSPVIEGIGKLRPSFRFQQAQARQTLASGESLDPSRTYDAQLTYVIMHWFAHVSVTYRHYDTAYSSPSAPAPAMAPAHRTGDMIVFGVQLWDP